MPQKPEAIIPPVELKGFYQVLTLIGTVLFYMQKLLEKPYTGTTTRQGAPEMSAEF